MVVDYLLIVLLSVSILCRGNHWLLFLCLLWFGVVWYLVGSACWMFRVCCLWVCVCWRSRACFWPGCGGFVFGVALVVRGLGCG